MRTVLLMLISMLFFSTYSSAETIQAEVLKVIDGDTVKVQLIGEMPELFKVQSIRFLGCDTAEKHDKNISNKTKANSASEFTATHVHPGDILILSDPKFDKYGGRLLAHVILDDKDMCDLLIESGLAHPYFGGKKDW